jgi:hypothetical protein
VLNATMAFVVNVLDGASKYAMKLGGDTETIKKRI